MKNSKFAGIILTDYKFPKKTKPSPTIKEYQIETIIFKNFYNCKFKPHKNDKFKECRQVL